MQAIMESIFDIAYLVSVIALGIVILRNAKGRKEFKLFGIMSIVLGSGDAFHLVPRIWALNTTGTENYAAALGFGTFVTSITMTIFYVMLYHFWRIRYKVNNKNNITAAIYALATVRIALCFFPQNQWLAADSPVSWGIYRNIPFAIIGLIIIVLFFSYAKKEGDEQFRYMWLAIAFSFLFYIPVVLWSSIVPAVGLFMIPKTCAYVWMVCMGYRAAKIKD